MRPGVVGLVGGWMTLADGSAQLPTGRTGHAVLQFRDILSIFFIFDSLLSLSLLALAALFQGSAMFVIFLWDALTLSESKSGRVQSRSFLEKMKTASNPPITT